MMVRSYGSSRRYAPLFVRRGARSSIPHGCTARHVKRIGCGQFAAETSHPFSNHR